MGSDPRVAAYEAASATFKQRGRFLESVPAACDAFLSALLAHDDTRDAARLAIAMRSPSCWDNPCPSSAADCSCLLDADAVLAVLSGFSQNRSET